MQEFVSDVAKYKIWAYFNIISWLLAAKQSHICMFKPNINVTGSKRQKWWSSSQRVTLLFMWNLCPRSFQLTDHCSDPDKAISPVCMCLCVQTINLN